MPIRGRRDDESLARLEIRVDLSQVQDGERRSLVKGKGDDSDHL